MIFGGPEGLYAFAMGAGGGIDMFRDGGGTDKADGLYTRVAGQQASRLIATVNNVKHAVRQASLLQKLRHT
ncbi:Uncharacterised protein [Salmonella enterica subsp. enterica serovar Bovismorbificans]|uniref:Uncharacterized protein n=1 Tax=Salmonella enterica subsp. enterica serovar Bovismorbificans TaxID=58097 RepID=A0A655DE15_SALET|nr:Uncharacterised protein [Salmonella enterica subsp. enterica serovar Bovismorbificans]